MKINHIIFLVGGVLVTGFLYSWWSTPLVVTVQGSGEVKVPATSAVISFQIAETQASSVMAISNLEAKAEAMRQVLSQNGVKGEDVVESQPRVVPSTLVTPGTSGFTATMTMGGKTTQVNQAAIIAAALYEKGATLVSQPVLTVDDQVTYANQAYEKAMEAAKKNAAQMSVHNGKLFKKIAAITQSTNAEGTVSTKSETEVGNTLTISKMVEVTYRMW